MNSPADRLAQRGLTLPVPPEPRASYVPVVRTGNLLFVSGQISENPAGIIHGRLGADLDTEHGQDAARYAALSVLAQIVHNGGTPMENIRRVVKLSVFVASTPDFNEQHLVANGASELIGEILGEAGAHARAAFGVAALPLGAAVEIEAIVEV